MASTPLFTVMCARILSPPGAWEYSNCRGSRGIIAFRLSVVLTEPPFSDGSIIVPTAVMAKSPRPRFRTFSVIALALHIARFHANANLRKRSWRHNSDSLDTAVSYLSTEYSIFKERAVRHFRFLPPLLHIRFLRLLATVPKAKNPYSSIFLSSARILSRRFWTHRCVTPFSLA